MPSEMSTVQILESQYYKLIEQCTPYTRAQILYTIIQIKTDSGNESCLDFNQTIYLDIKFFIDSYVDSLRTQAFGYDYFDLNRIFELYRHVKPKEASSLNNYLIRILKVQGYDNELSECKNKGEELLLAEYKEGSIIYFLYKYLLFQSSKNIFAIIITTLLISMLYAIVLLPSPHGFCVLFEVTYDQYSSYFLLNHALNLMAAVLDLGESFSVKSTNLFGLCLMMLGKLALILIVGNYLLQEINKKITE